MKLKILFHGNCFDGAASAGLFQRFYRETIRPDAEVAFAPMEHKGAGPAIPPELLDGDENACVDFRYTSHPRLDWWFDHHVSAFQSPEDEAHFRAYTGDKKFFDPAAKSCARFLATTCAQKFGWNAAPVAELVHWAEIIDGALFPDPKMPVEQKEPALQLMTWVENNRDQKLAERFIGELVSKPLAEIAASPYVTGPLAGILEQHRRNVDVVKERARLDSGVVFTDLSDAERGAMNKFIVYYLYPEARYAVSVLATAKRMKISVGSNPWSPVPRTHDIAKICERYGGGGHPVVGAISLPRADVDGAKRIAAEIVAELSRS